MKLINWKKTWHGEVMIILAIIITATKDNNYYYWTQHIYQAVC